MAPIYKYNIKSKPYVKTSLKEAKVGNITIWKKAEESGGGSSGGGSSGGGSSGGGSTTTLGRYILNSFSYRFYLAVRYTKQSGMYPSGVTFTQRSSGLTSLGASGVWAVYGTNPTTGTSLYGYTHDYTSQSVSYNSSGEPYFALRMNASYTTFDVIYMSNASSGGLFITGGYPSYVSPQTLSI